MKNLMTLQRQMDRYLEDLWGGGRMTGIQEPAFTPSCDIEETEGHVLLSFDLPGVKKENIKIEIDSGILTVSGERREEREESRKGRFRTERFHGSFARSFQLPAGVRSEQIEAQYADGVLRLAVPKTAAATRSEPVKINEGKSGFWERLLGPKQGSTQEKRSPDKVA